MGNSIKDEIVTTLKSYIYLDEVEINGLYYQIYPNILEETTTYESKKNNDINGVVGGSFFDMVKADVELQHSSDNNYLSEIKTSISVEHKTNVIIKDICENRFKHLDDIVETANASHSLLRGRIIVGYAAFVLTQIYDSENRLIDLDNISNNFDRKNATFILESGCRNQLERLRMVEETDFYRTYYSTYGKYGYEMHMSGNKIRRDIRHLTQVIKRGKMFNFTVLGHISYAGESQYAIKPFAIW